MAAQNKSWKWRIAQWLEYRWWQRYLQEKDPRAYLAWKTDYWRQLLQELAAHYPQKEGLDILDAGCGPAGIFMVLQGHRVHAIDPLLDKYRQLPHFLPDEYPWVRFEQMPLESLDAANVYDRIYCLNAINHVRNLDACYDNLVSATKPGGYLVISTDAHRYTFLKKLFQWIPGDALHPVQMDIAEYTRKLTERNMDIIANILYKKAGIFNYYITIARKRTDQRGY